MSQTLKFALAWLVINLLAIGWINLVGSASIDQNNADITLSDNVSVDNFEDLGRFQVGSEQLGLSGFWAWFWTVIDGSMFVLIIYSFVRGI